MNTRWTLELAEGWEASWDEDVYTATGPAGVGALQCSGARKPGGSVTEADLREFASAERADDLLNVTHGEFSGVQREFVDDEARYWKQAWLTDGTNLLLFVTYNCVEAEREVEAEAVEAMLRSLRSVAGGAE